MSIRLVAAWPMLDVVAGLDQFVLVLPIRPVMA